MSAGRCFKFRRAIVRTPSQSIVNGLRAGTGRNPEYAAFVDEHAAYIKALQAADVAVTVLSPLEAFPDSVFVEDAALCTTQAAIVLRPGASSRSGEAQAIRPALQTTFDTVLSLPGEGLVDGGDILLFDTVALVGLSARTDEAGFVALETVLNSIGYAAERVITPDGVLHFKSDCGLLDNETVFATSRLASSGCFAHLRVIEVPAGEEAAANLVRVNDVVFVPAGFPRSQERLEQAGYDTRTLNVAQAACVDGGLSCMSLRIP
jgi:dimethylargininase